MNGKCQRLTDIGNSGPVDGVSEALKEFNRWHGREAVARLIKLEGSSVVVELSGPFCRTCGLYDYFDDVKLELEKALGRQLEMTEVDGGGADSYVIAYRIGGS